MQDRTAEQQTLEIMLVVLLIGGIAVVVVAFGFGTVYARRALVPIRQSLANQRAALRRQRDFAADASHELRTPLTVIRSSVEHLERHRDEPVAQVGSALEDIDDEVRHMTSIVEDLLLLARSDSGAIELERVPVDLGDVVADGASALAKPAADRGVRVEVDPEPAIVDRRPGPAAPARDDPRRQRHPAQPDRRPRRGRRVRTDPSGATLTVEDEGPGIRPEDLPHVFERFYRAPGAPGGGTGLGLAIAAWIVERHGGRIAVANRPTGGATLRASGFPRPVRRPRAAGRSGGRRQVAVEAGGPDDSVIRRDGQRLVVPMPGDPGQPIEPHHERGRRIGVDVREPWPHHGQAAQRRSPVLRSVGRRCACHARTSLTSRRPVTELEDGRDAIGAIGMADADAPGPPRLGRAAHDDVAAGVDRVVGDARRRRGSMPPPRRPSP